MTRNGLCRVTFLPLTAVSLTASAAALVYLIPNLKHFLDKTGAVATFNTLGDINEKGVLGRTDAPVPPVI